MPWPSNILAGATVLVVDDDWFVAYYVGSVIQAVGGTVLGPHASAAAALACLAGPESLPHVALLNLGLHDGDALPVAHELTRTSVPILFSSTRMPVDRPTCFARWPLLTSPFAAYQVVDELVGLLAGRHGEPERLVARA